VPLGIGRGRVVLIGCTDDPLIARANASLGAITSRDVVIWAVEQELLELPDIDPYDILADQMANALREEYQRTCMVAAIA